MTPGLDLAPKRTRESTSKVRTGCSTCKARRVKCDEAKPICRRCAVGSRKCEYNTTRPTPPSRNVITVYLAPTQRPPVIFRNDRGFDFFHHSLATKLDGQFDSKFWSRLVLQLSHSEPSIRHAVSAISVIYQDFELSLRNPAGYVNANPKAQREWDKAIKSLAARIQTHPDSHLVPLTCCLLFTCIEFLGGKIMSAMVHVQNGINILAALRRNNSSASSPGSNLSSSDLEAIDDHIVPMFLGLNVLCSLAGTMTPPTYAPTPQEDSPHEDLAHSRRRFLVISDTCIRFINKSQRKMPLFDMDHLIEQFKLQKRLGAWRSQLDELVPRMQAAGNPVKEDALNLLLAHYKVLYIWMQVCTTAGEMATDSHHADFEEVVYHAEQTVKPMATPQLLSFDIQILGLLYYATLKCRHPVLRRRALELIKLAPRREGLWNAHYAYVTAKRVIELEEKVLNEQGLPDETSRLYAFPMPDDSSRVNNPGEVDIRKAGHSIVPSPACPGTVKIIFHAKPWGLTGEWQTITEYIKL